MQTPQSSILDALKKASGSQILNQLKDSTGTSAFQKEEQEMPPPPPPSKISHQFPKSHFQIDRIHSQRCTYNIMARKPDGSTICLLFRPGISFGSFQNDNLASKRINPRKAYFSNFKIRN